MVQALWEVLRSGDLQPIDGMGKGKVRVEWMLLCKRCVCVCVWICACICMLYFVVSKEIHIDSLSLSLSPSLPLFVISKISIKRQTIVHGSYTRGRKGKRKKRKIMQ